MRFPTGSALESFRRIRLTEFVSATGSRYVRELMINGASADPYFIVTDASLVQHRPPRMHNTAYCINEDDPDTVDYRETEFYPGGPAAVESHSSGTKPATEIPEAVRYMLRCVVTDEEVVQRYPHLKACHR